MAYRTGPQFLPEDPVTIVGAGPAGLVCAIVLARAGRTVVVREWRKTVGSRFHGDFQGQENRSDERDILAELRNAGIETSFDCHPVRQSTVFDARAQACHVHSERPLYDLVRRGGRGASLDFGLLKQAIEAGAEVRFIDRVTGTSGPTVLATGPRHADLRMQQPRPFGGFANFCLPRTAMQGGQMVVGEQTGFQDALAGFGMRYSLRSGILAARSIINNLDYTRAWRCELMPPFSWSPLVELRGSFLCL